MTELLPCPACGGSPSVRTQGNDHTRSRKVTIKCPACRLERTDAAMRNGMDWLVQTAVTNWNTRATAAPVPYVETLRSLADVFNERSGYWSRHKGEYAQGKTNAYCESEADLRAALVPVQGTAAPVVVGEGVAREVIEAAKPFLADPNPQLGGGYLMNILVQASATRRLKAAIKSLTAALAGDHTIE